MRRQWAIVVLLLCPLAAAAESSVWRVTGAQGHFYLAGSIHVLRGTDYPLPPEFDAAYADAQVVVLETDLTEAAQSGAQKLLAQGSYPPGDTIQHHLSPAIYQRLAAYCAARELPLAALERFKPWLLVMTLTLTEMEAEGFAAEAGLDRHFAQRAARDGKPVAGLEAFDEQIAVLAAFDGDGDPLVASFLEEAESYPRVMAEMVRAWRGGDADALNRLVTQGMREKYPNLYRAVLVDRNRRWIAPLIGWATSGRRVLAIVGAAHLVGDDSVIALLRARGYKVEQLKLR